MLTREKKGRYNEHRWKGNSCKGKKELVKEKEQGVKVKSEGGNPVITKAKTVFSERQNSKKK